MTEYRWWTIAGSQGALHGYGTEEEADEYARLLDERDGLEVGLWVSSECDDYDEDARDDGFDLESEIPFLRAELDERARR